MVSKDTISLVFTGILVACALVVTSLVVATQLLNFSFEKNTDSTNVRYVKQWKEVAREGNLIGSSDAPVKIVEYFDYECPYCGRLQPTLTEIRERYPDRVALVARHLPLPNHAQAMAAARASECAAIQGRFAEYHAGLLAQQDRLKERPWVKLAEKTGVADIRAFVKCINSNEVNERLRSDVTTAQELGINSIPTLIVNGRLVTGSVSAETLDLLVQQALQE